GSADPEQRGLLERAIAIAAGVSIDGTADDGIVTQGERVQIEVGIWNAGDSTVRVDSINVGAPAGWTLERLESGLPSVAPGAVVTRRFVLTVARDAERTQPYFLRRPLTNRGGLYDWSMAPAAVRGLPFEPPPVTATVRLFIGGEPVTLTREVVYRYRDHAIREIRRPIFVTRHLDVAITPDELLWPIDGGVGAQQPGHFTSTASGRSGRSVESIDYPHTRPRAWSRRSVAQVRAARLALPGLSRVGYVRGAADRVPEALLAVGVPLDLISPDSLARGDLSRYDAIVIGSRAYETEPALVANNGRLIEYARNGGLLIVQYQQYPFVDGGFAPYPLHIARPHDRVTDENASVTALDPAHPVFHYPNEIGPDGWRGWVQERGLYFAHDWDTPCGPA